MGGENNWELRFTGGFFRKIKYACFTVERDCRGLICILDEVESRNGIFHKFYLRSTDFFENATLAPCYELPFTFGHCCFYACSMLICHRLEEIHFVNVSNGEVINSIYVGEVADFFFVPSKRLLLLFMGSGVIKHFKVHNLPL